MLSSLDTAGFEWPISGNDVFRRMLPCLHRLWSIQVFSRENDHGDRERPGLCADACILSLSRMLSSKDGISDTLRSGDIHGQASLLSVLPFSSMVSDVIGRKVTWEKKKSHDTTSSRANDPGRPAIRGFRTSRWIAFSWHDRTNSRIG